MSGWISFIKSLNSTGPIPTMASPLYIVFIILLVGSVVGLVFFNKKINKTAYKYSLLAVWIVIVILEVFKQITFCYAVFPDGNVSFRYNWTFFPFQFCSSIIYLLPVIIFCKEGVIRKRFELFGSCFFLFGGLMGVFIPSFSQVKWINYHTLIYHGLMVLVSILLALQNKKEFKFINFAESSLIFVGLLIIAVLLNAIIPACRPESLEPWSGFNMFIIDWHRTPDLPVLKQLWNAVPYPVYFFIYLFGVLALNLLIYIIWSAILNHRVDFQVKIKHAKKKNTKKQN